MAIVKKTGKQVEKLILIIGAVLSLFFIAASTQENPEKKYFELKEQNALEDYINLAFDQIDENPNFATKADSIFNKIWRTPTTYDEKLAYYHLVINIAYHLLKSGQVRASTRWYEQAFRFYQQEKSNSALAEEMEFEEYVCKPLGNNYTRIGDYSKAVIIQQTALASAIYNKKAQMLPALYANLATTYLNMQDYSAVQNVCNKGLAVINSYNNSAVLLYNLKAEAYLKTNKLDSAKLWNSKALTYSLAPSEKAGAHITSLVNKAHILIAENNRQTALSYLLKAWDMEYMLTAREKAKVANEIGVTYLALDDWQESKSWFKKALSYFTRDSLGLYPDYTVTSSMFGLAKSFEKSIHADSTSQWYVQAVLNDYYTQQLIDPWLFNEGSIYSNEINTEQAIAWHHSMYDTTKNNDYLWQAVWIAELSKGRKLIYEQFRTKQWQSQSASNITLLNELKEDYLLLAQAREDLIKNDIKKRIAEKEYRLSLSGNLFSSSLSVPSYKAFLKWINKARHENIIVSYYCSDHSMYRVSISENIIEHVVDTTCTDDEITSFVNKYFYNGPTTFNNDPNTYFKASHTLLKKYLPSVVDKHSYIVSPAGAIHQLPIEALSLNPDSASYFGISHAVSYQYSLLQLINTPDRVQATVNLFAIETPHLGFPVLPGSKQEVDFLRKQFKTHKYIAEETTDSVFYDALNKKNIIHLSSHAVAGDSNSQPYIVLKNKLYLGQIQFNTAQCPLIVLAACETGKGITLQNEGMLSLGRTFLSKGVGGVLSSRWSIDDEATSFLIKTFYKELKKGKEPAVALKEARVAYFKEHASVIAQNPWLWSALYYQGVNQRIDLVSADYGWVMVVVIILIAAIIFFICKWKKKRKQGKQNFLNTDII